MTTLHIAPGDSAGGSLEQAIRGAGRGEEVLRFRDDLSCGPIDSDDHSARVAWWSRFYDIADVTSDFETFWNRVETTGDRLVIWFGRHSASELAFFLALADRLRDRPYDIVDVTGTVAIIPANQLAALLGSERPITAHEREEASQKWRQLRRENAPFRVVSPTGLVSAPVDHFDSLLIEQATPEWQRMVRIVGAALGYSSEPYYQVGDLMLLTRVVALIEAGKLLADGDPWDMHACKVRLPG